MNHFQWDASALAKRYATEVGTPLINDFFTKASRSRMICIYICTGEVISILVRKKNGGLITQAAFAQAMADFRAEVLDDPNFRLISITDSLIDASHPLIEKHSLNATDALILQATLETAVLFQSVGDSLVLISSDQRLLRAAKAEGLVTFNPEINSQTQLDALI
jgi:predicted nucleic acid-binding protein